MQRDCDLISLSAFALERMLPMHLLMAPGGSIISIGPTLRKVLGCEHRHVTDCLTASKGRSSEPIYNLIEAAATHGERLFLKMAQSPGLTLRGHAVASHDGAILLNLGFGIGLTDAISMAKLTDRDFAPSELAMEFLFLHEANRGVLQELSRFNQQLDAARAVAEVQAHTDPLTGLTNRRGVEIALAAALNACRDRDVGGFALAQIDLDRFKEVNDKLGHAAGDEILCGVADILREAIRSNDTAARVGGDEFLLILRDLEDAPTLDRLARRVIERIEARMPLRVPGSRVSASIGIVLSRAYRDMPEDRILHDADIALYRSKHAGRGQVTILTKALPIQTEEPL